MNKGKITQRVFHAHSTEVLLDEEQQGLAFKQGKSTEARSGKTAFIETYGCQMNFSDTEIIASVLTDIGYDFTQDESQADLVLLNTCSIRENAEAKIWNRLHSLKAIKKARPGTLIGLMGCMAERLKSNLLSRDQLVDIVVGPDAYRSLPELISEAEGGMKSVNVLLSREETYADISPVRLSSNGVTSFVTIMRGCDNMCSFCVVPFTRGRERSRDPETILHEMRQLAENGYREVTLLGQNVDSYRHEGVNFAGLLTRAAAIDPLMRIRFSTSHPKDITDDVLEAIAMHNNICKQIHLPVQSGSSRVLELMRRGYDREWYMKKVSRIREIIPDCSISTDIIAGFCTETEKDHKETLEMIEWAKYSQAFMFCYSERPGTLAERQYEDDIPLAVKKERLNQIIAIQRNVQSAVMEGMKGSHQKVLVEGDSKRSSEEFCGRTDGNMMTVFPKAPGMMPGDYVDVRIAEAGAITLRGEAISPAERIMEIPE